MNRSQTRAARLMVVVATAIAAIALSACSGTDSQSEESSPDIDTSSPETGNPTEVPTPDNGGGGTSVSLPSAPVGGQSEAPGDDQAFQCLSVNWLAGDDATIPEGATVALGDFSFDPAVFDVAGSGCEDQGPHCNGFSFSASELSCSLPLQYNGGEFSADTFEAAANVSGEASCDGDSSECGAFLAAVVNQSPAQLSVSLPPVEDDETTDPTDPTEPTEGG